jgi:hypothetical protein
MASDVKLNSGGIAAILKSGEMLALVESAAEEIAANVRSQGIMVEGVPGDIALPVDVRTRVGDRAAASVALAHPSGIAVQAKHGALTKAASAAGLTVR